MFPATNSHICVHTRECLEEMGGCNVLEVWNPHLFSTRATCWCPILWGCGFSPQAAASPAPGVSETAFGALVSGAQFPFISVGSSSRLLPLGLLFGLSAALLHLCAQVYTESWTECVGAHIQHMDVEMGVKVRGWPVF